MERVIIYKSQKKALIITVSSFVVALAGYWLLQQEGKEVIGWCLTIVWILMLLLGVGTFLDRKPKIILTGRGITETTSIREEIEWDAILQVDEFFYRGQHFIRLLVDRNYKPELLVPTWFYRFDRMYAQQGVKALFIRVSLLDMGPMRLAGIIRRMIKSENRQEVLESI